MEDELYFIEAVINVAKNYGTQFSSSRADIVPKAMARCTNQGDEYFGVAAAIDYAFIEQAIYRQMLLAINERSRELNVKTVHLGFGAPLEKKRVGATSFSSFLYVQQLQHFSFEAMNEMSLEASK